LVGPAAVWMLAFLGLPLLSILVFSVFRLEGTMMVPALDFRHYQEILAGATNWRILTWSLIVMATVAIADVLLALPIAFFIARMVRNEAVQMAILALFIIPFWTNYLVRVTTWIPMFGRNGVINGLLMSLGIIEEPLDILLFSPFSMLLALVVLNIVGCVAPMAFFLRRIPENLLEAARDLGARPIQVFWNVQLPLMVPGMVTGAFFTIVATLSEFSTAQIIGGDKAPMLAGTIRSQILYFQWPQASALSVVLLLVIVLVVSLLFRYQNIAKYL
jgi:putative spermidine/putrescine transport system permease protein